MIFFELVMSLSSTTEAMVVKVNGMLVDVSSFYAWGCYSQATIYVCDPVPYQVTKFRTLPNTDSTRNGHCVSLRLYFENRVSLLVCHPNIIFLDIVNRK